MPKLKCFQQQVTNRSFRAVVMKQLIVLNLSKDELAKVLCMSRSTLWAKLNDPTQFRVGELIQLHTTLQFSEEEKELLF